MQATPNVSCYLSIVQSLMLQCIAVFCAAHAYQNILTSFLLDSDKLLFFIWMFSWSIQSYMI